MSKVAAIVHGGAVGRQGDVSEILRVSDMRLKADRLIIVDEQQNSFLNVRRRSAGGLVEVVYVDVRGIRTRTHRGTGCAGILNSTYKLDAVDERHGTLRCEFGFERNNIAGHAQWQRAYQTR